MPQIVPFTSSQRAQRGLGQAAESYANYKRAKREEEAFAFEKAQAEAAVLREENERLKAERQEAADRSAMAQHATAAGGSLLDATAKHAPQMLPGTQKRLESLMKLRPHMSQEGMAYALQQFRAEEAEILFNAGKTKLMANMARSLRSPGVAEDETGAAALGELAQAVQEAQTPQDLARAEKAFQAEQKAVSKRRKDAKVMTRGMEYLEGVRRAFQAAGDDDMTARVETVLSDWEADVYKGDYADMKRALRAEIGDMVDLPSPMAPPNPNAPGGPGIVGLELSAAPQGKNGKAASTGRKWAAVPKEEQGPLLDELRVLLLSGQATSGALQQFLTERGLDPSEASQEQIVKALKAADRKAQPKPQKAAPPDEATMSLWAGLRARAEAMGSPEEAGERVGSAARGVAGEAEEMGSAALRIAEGVTDELSSTLGSKAKRNAFKQALAEELVGAAEQTPEAIQAAIERAADKVAGKFGLSVDEIKAKAREVVGKSAAFSPAMIGAKFLRGFVEGAKE